MKGFNTVVGVWAHSLNCKGNEARKQFPAYANYVADCSQDWQSGIWPIQNLPEPLRQTLIMAQVCWLMHCDATLLAALHRFLLAL